jgi:hypothetical protein
MAERPIGDPICGDIDPRAYRLVSSFLYTCPPFITKTTRRTELMSLSGLPTVAMMSASLPAAIDLPK